MDTTQIANQIARLEANRSAMTMEAEVSRMAALQELHQQFTTLGGDEADLERRIKREVDAVERSMRNGEYDD